MQLTIFNGSPRGKSGNSEIILSWLISGLQQQADINIDTLYLNKTGSHSDYINSLQTSDTAILIFPLYTDCMPGIVMAFIEMLEPLRKSLSGLNLGFIVHSGFPEPLQSRHVEKYLQWLCCELGAKYLGTAIMGSSEGMQMMPPSMTNKKRELFSELGRRLPIENKFNDEIVKKIAGREKMSKIGTLFFRIVAKTGLTNFYWDLQLKKNNAFKNRFDKPYAK